MSDVDFELTVKIRGYQPKPGRLTFEKSSPSYGERVVVVEKGWILTPDMVEWVDGDEGARAAAARAGYLLRPRPEPLHEAENSWSSDAPIHPLLRRPPGRRQSKGKRRKTSRPRGRR